jgi:DNA-binding beta-propeller fold protein YncE
LDLQDKNIFAVIDPATYSIIGQYFVRNCIKNHGMVLDVKNRLAFLICENNDVMTVLNLETYKPVAYFKIASGSDVVKYDPRNKRIYVACSSGVISIFTKKMLLILLN